MFPPGDSTIVIGTYISSERITRATGSGPHPFSRSVVFAGRGDQLLIGGAERLQIEVRSLDGELLEIYRGPDAELVIDEEFLASYRRAELPPGDSVLRDWLEAAEYPMPERYPAYTDLLADPRGYVWVERFVAPWESDQRAWGVFDPDGVFLGRLQVPPGLAVTDVTADHVVGVAHDDLGVPRIRVYRLERLETAPHASISPHRLPHSVSERAGQDWRRHLLLILDVRGSRLPEVKDKGYLRTQPPHGAPFAELSRRDSPQIRRPYNGHPEILRSRLR
jgi:hypothetical protein